MNDQTDVPRSPRAAAALRLVPLTGLLTGPAVAAARGGYVVPPAVLYGPHLLLVLLLIALIALVIWPAIWSKEPARREAAYTVLMLFWNRKPAEVKKPPSQRARGRPDS